jgi:GNAT superfamily N-acetyltransferase
LPLTLRKATSDELGFILELLNDSIRWLQGMGIDQWATPWPDEERRNERIARDLSEGKTWFALDGMAVAGTITIDPNHNDIWPAEKRSEKAVYVRRVIVGRHYAGLGLGARMLDWAADVAARAHEARWIRIDVWTTNRRLHAYYRHAPSSSGAPTRVATSTTRCSGPRRRSLMSQLPIAVQVAIQFGRPCRFRE